MFVDYVLVSIDEVIQDTKQVNAMNEEIKEVKKNNKWEITTFLQGQKAIDVKWIFKIKKKSNGKVER